MNKIQKLIMTKGLPASGKSYWAKEYIIKNPSFKRINKDLLRLMIDDGVWSKNNEKIILKARNALIELFIDAKCSVIIDDTNLAPSHEITLREIAKKKSIAFEVKDFTDVPLAICIERDRKRADYVGEAVIKKMYKQFLKKEEVVVMKEKNPNLQDCIIVDIDGTIANNRQNRSWNDYETVYNDEVKHEVLEIIEATVAGNHVNKVFIFSGRENIGNCYNETLRWLEDKVFPKYPHIANAFVCLELRNYKDYRKDAIVKKEMFDKFIDGKFNIKCVFDDRNQVVEMWRGLGVLVMQVADGDF